MFARQLDTPELPCQPTLRRALVLLCLAFVGVLVGHLHNIQARAGLSRLRVHTRTAGTLAIFSSESQVAYVLG